jgi:hypothetical protein
VALTIRPASYPADSATSTEYRAAWFEGHGKAWGWLVARCDAELPQAHDALVARAVSEFGAAPEIEAEARAALAAGVAWWSIDRDRTRFAIRRALAGLLAKRAPAAALIAAAHAVNDRRGRPLAPQEVVRATRHEVARELGRERAPAR